MAGKSPNMKVNVTADNSDFKKRMQESKTAVRDFERFSEDALSSLGEAFGVNARQVEQVTSAIKGLGVKMQESGSTGAQAFGKLLAGANGLALGLAGIGIGGVVAGFKALKDEAGAFKNTVQGANIELQTQAYISTYKQFVHDYNEEIGKGAAQAESKWKKFWGTFGSQMKLYLSSGAFGGATDAVLAYGDALTKANKAARTAEDIANEIYATQRQISDKAVEWARQEREIAEYKRTAYDKTQDALTQQKALNKATELIKQRYQEEADLKGKLASLQVQYNDLVSSSAEDIDKANQLLIVAEKTTAGMNNALRELSERQATVTSNVQKEAQARAEALKYAQEVASSRASLADWSKQAVISTEKNLESILPKGVTAMELPGLTIPITPTLDTQATLDITNELQSLMTSSFEGIGNSIGMLIGDLATGEDAWGNFANAAMSSFGDLAISIGKTAIAAGVATLGIKAALESLNGFVAIAAGVALVALGAAIKTSLSNIAGGGYSASGNVASAGSSYSSSNAVNTEFEQREMNIKVTGELRASGSQLEAVISNEKNRKNHTT